MTPIWPQRAAWLGAFAGLALALLLFAPARWLAQALNHATGGQLQLVNPSGTVWQGQADLLLTGGAGSRSESALPRGVGWRLSLRLVSGAPAVGLLVSAPCCTPQPLAFLLLPRWGGAEWRLAASSSQWPAELLVGLGTPWNTLRMEGQLALQTEGLTLRWDQGRANLQGSLVVDAQDMASRLSRLRPLGSYRFELKAAADGHTAMLDLTTLRGDLLLQGNGQWVGGRLRFKGEAQAAAGREEALTNLLNIMGRRQGPRSVFNIG
ncbi:MAG: type II secretion system protein N [Hydrogenophaga sp.]|uniref:type II secretion system protein N n=1 Tax=Hydrogenophaga sp. TaxID=1904254 RepID=UPI002731CAFE|nr:type II secretion system protein N [Hydrogenophaga sp.]MDP2162879.1 type II secretion system protein N [Hydrogenophaga sp.]MDP3474397.1 type II secretion system protein N [Hydrogenophaga sp.]